MLSHIQREGVARVELDYVLPQYRDFTPGEFVYRPDGPFNVHGIRRVIAPTQMRNSSQYLRRVGFRGNNGRLILDFDTKSSADNGTAPRTDADP